MWRAVFFMLVVLGGQVALGADSGWKLEFGHAGYAVPGTWVPLRVSLAASMNACSLELVRRGEDGVAGGVESWNLAAGSSCEIPIFYDEFAATLDFRLIADGVELGQVRIVPGDQVFSGHVVLTVGIGTADRAAIGKVLFPAEPVLALPVRIDTLPSQLLNWDAISAVVIVDPGAVLSPARLNAMRSWLDCGGILVVTQARPGGASVADQLVAGWTPHTALGGRIVRMTGNSDTSGGSSRIAFWKDTLGLLPYGQSGRLFMRQIHLSTDGSIIKSVPVAEGMGNLVWFAVAIACGLGAACFFRKRWLPIVLSISVVGLVVAGFAHDGLVRQWDRGLATHARVFVLPGGGSVLFDATCWRPDYRQEGRFDTELSPWGLALAWVNDEQGLCRFGVLDGSRWLHGRSSSGLALRRMSDKSVVLTTVLPVSAAAIQLSATARVVFDSAHASFKWSAVDGQGRWRTVETVPAAFSADQLWIENLARRAPQQIVEIGLDAWPGNSLSVGNLARPEVCWARLGRLGS